MQVLHTHSLPGAAATLRRCGDLARLWPGTLLVFCLVVRARLAALGGCLRAGLQHALPAAAHRNNTTLHGYPSLPTLALPPSLQCFIFVGTTLLAARQVALIAANLTTNEYILRHK